DQILVLPLDSATLTGAGTDADGTISSYLWTKISGPAAGTITNDTLAITGVTGLVPGVYKFELKVTDNANATGRDTVQITLNNIVNIVPVANAGNNVTITLPVNVAALSGIGTDPDGIISSYQWTKISG